MQKKQMGGKKSNTQNYSTYYFSTESIFSAVQLTLTIRIHLIRERPNPEMAPYRPAAEVVRQKDRKNPIQLKRNATVKGERWKISDMSCYPRSKSAFSTFSCLHDFPKDKRQPSLPSTTLTPPPQSKQENILSEYQVLHYCLLLLTLKNALTFTKLCTYNFTVCYTSINKCPEHYISAPKQSHPSHSSSYFYEFW